MMNFESVADTIVNKNISFNVIAIGTSKLDHCLVLFQTFHLSNAEADKWEIQNIGSWEKSCIL